MRKRRATCDASQAMRLRSDQRAASCSIVQPLSKSIYLSFKNIRREDWESRKQISGGGAHSGQPTYGRCYRGNPVNFQDSLTVLFFSKWRDLLLNVPNVIIKTNTMLSKRIERTFFFYMATRKYNFTSIFFTFFSDSLIFLKINQTYRALGLITEKASAGAGFPKLFG